MVRLSQRASRITIAAMALLQGAQAKAGFFDLSYRGSVSWWNSFQHNPALEDSSVNPGNLVLRLPEDKYSSELRPNIKFVSPSLQLILRPRLRYTLRSIKTTGETSSYQRTQFDSFISEGFIQWTASENLAFTAGIQSYQWGAAEVFSPSNRIFHETAQDRTNLFEARGRYIARVNYSMGKNFSTVLMSEVKENKDNVDLKPYSAEETWEPTFLIKPEISWNNSADYCGIVLGNRDQGRPWVGEYFNYTIPFAEGLTIYADASHEQGSHAWYPVRKTLAPVGPPLVTFERSKKEEETVRSFVVSGIRYDFEDGSIGRLEYIENDAGYTKAERDLALSAFTSPLPQQLALRTDNTQRFLAPGLELSGRRLIYASVYIPNPLSLKDLVFFARGLRSLSDQTGTYYGSAEYTVGDAGTFSYAYSQALGSKDGEVKGFAAPLHIIAYRQDW